MIQFYFRSFLFCFIIFFFQHQVAAQSDSTSYKYWINGGIKLNNLNNLGVHLSYNFSLSSLYAQAIFSAQRIPDGEGSIEPLVTGLAIGSRYSRRFYLAAGFIGPSIVWGNKINTDKNYFSTLGLNINGQLFFKLIPEIGLGIEVIQNFNTVKSFTSFHLSLSINNNK